MLTSSNISSYSLKRGIFLFTLGISLSHAVQAFRSPTTSRSNELLY
jgi:hypothetical protein